LNVQVALHVIPPLTKRILLLGAVLSAGCATGEPDPCLGQAESALRVCADGAIVEGIDVSYYQGTVNWTDVKQAGKLFAIVRVSDGLNYPDTQFERNWRSTKAAGIIRGTYQFFRPGQDPTRQADLLLSRIEAAGGLVPGDLPPVLDIEVTDGQSSATVVQRAKTWLQRVERAIGRKPLVYTAAFMSSVIGSNLSAYPLWVANWGVTCPLMPTGWTDWKFWQKSSTGRVSGISGNVDLDVFNGSLAELRAFAIQSEPDAGAPRDGGSDGGARDGGPPSDGGAPDAGTGADAGAPDGGAVAPDGGPDEDAGAPDGGAGNSAGETLHDGGVCRRL
jgi:lysozyme